MSLPFGTPVALDFEVKAHYVEVRNWRTDVQPMGLQSGAVAFGLNRKVEDGVLRYKVVDGMYGSYGEHSEDVKVIPGESLPESEIPSTNGTHRVLRRHALEGAKGLIVGRSWLVEGRYFGASGGSSYGEYGDYEQASLSESRRVPIYRVAVDPGEMGDRFWSPIIAAAIPEDLRVLDPVS